MIEQALQRGLLRGPGPAVGAERIQVVLLEAPGEGIAGEDAAALVEIDHAAASVAGYGDGEEIGPERRGVAAREDPVSEGRGLAVGLVDPDPRAEMLRVAFGVA